MRNCGLRAALVAVTACAVFPACNRGADRPDVSNAPGPAAEQSSSSTGTLRGIVRLTGAQIPDPSLIENTTDPEICGRVQQTQDLVVQRDDRGIANVIVALRGVPPEKVPAATRPDRLVLDNRNCQFVPHVAVLSVGGTIETVSHDAVLHTVHFYGALERNVALPNESATTTVTVSEPGMIAVLCDVHGWMKAFIRVDSHPFHAVTDAEGTFVIEGIPAGVYELDAWHERLGSQSVSVGIEPGAIAEVELTYALADR